MAGKLEPPYFLPFRAVAHFGEIRNLSSEPSTVTRRNAATNLKRSIARSLKRQGFQVEKGRIGSLDGATKAEIRQLHSDSVKRKLKEEAGKLAPVERQLFQSIAGGDEVFPERIDPELVEVSPGSDDALLFRYIQLHWSVPVSKGYGRRLRFLVRERLAGVIWGIPDKESSGRPRRRPYGRV